MTKPAAQPARARGALRFTYLALTNWRNFKQAEMRPAGRAFIVGPNASGKSNLLDALRFLRDIAKPTGGLAAALAAHHRRSFKDIRCLEAKNPSHVGIEITVGTDDELERWRYILRIQVRRGERFATVEHEEVRLRGQLVKTQSRGDAPDADAYAQCLLQQASERSGFRELVDFLTSIRYLHVVPQIVRDARRHLSDSDDPYGGDLLRRISDMKEKFRKPRLAAVGKALSLAVPQFGSLNLEKDGDGRPHLVAGYKHWRPHASPHAEEVFSDGTLRLIGFLWSITEGGGPLLLEEPELSLHEAVVQQLPDMIQRARQLSGRQVIATTHAAAMLNNTGIGADEVHWIDTSRGWSVIRSLSEDPRARAQIDEGGWTVGQAVLPMIAPTNIDQLGRLNVALD